MSTTPTARMHALDSAATHVAALIETLAQPAQGRATYALSHIHAAQILMAEFEPRPDHVSEHVL